MRKIIILALVVLLFSGCAGINRPPPQEVIIKIQSDTPVKVEAGEKIIKNMEVRNPEGELSSASFINDGIGYMKLWGGLGAWDATAVWNDLLLFERVYKVQSISVYISSGGGSAFSGLALADEIERIAKRIPVTMYARGIIASATVPVFACGTKRIASVGTIFMVHPAKIFKWVEDEGEKDLISQQKMFKLLKARYLEKLVAHSKSTVDEWKAREEETTWFDVREALEWGLVDQIE